MRRGSKAHWAAVASAATLLSLSCAAAPPRPAPPPDAASAAAEPVLANELLAHALYSKLDADPLYYFRHVDVRVDGGVAYLSGYVWSTDALYRARYIASSMPGVTGVVTSQLELERNGGRNNGPTR